MHPKHSHFPSLCRFFTLPYCALCAPYVSLVLCAMCCLVVPYMCLILPSNFISQITIISVYIPSCGIILPYCNCAPPCLMLLVFTFAPYLFPACAPSLLCPMPYVLCVPWCPVLIRHHKAIFLMFPMYTICCLVEYRAECLI